MKLLFVNGSRGEWGYIKPIIKRCISEKISYSICATNMLMLPNYGCLVDEIKRDGFKVDDEIFMSLEGSNHYTMVKSLGIFLISFVDVIYRQKPDWIILAGDRGEQLMASIAGAYSYIPVAHIQAGERSGNIDGIARHALGKFAHLHFASNEDASNRLLKLGEEPFRVKNVGAPQLDELIEEEFSSPELLSKKYLINDNEPYLLIVQHPVTEEMHLAEKQINILQHSLKDFNIKKIWILPNNDAGAEIIRKSLIENRNSDSLIFENLTRTDYLGLLKNCKAIIGNSSSGLLEAPTFSIPCVNIGRRQHNRVKGKNVIDCSFNYDECCSAIKKALSKEFLLEMDNCKNPYGDGKSSKRILNILQETKIDNKLLIKEILF